MRCAGVKGACPEARGPNEGVQVMHVVCDLRGHAWLPPIIHRCVYVRKQRIGTTYFNVRRPFEPSNRTSHLCPDMVPEDPGAVSEHDGKVPVFKAPFACC